MISRGIAAFLGGFTLLNLLGNLLARGFDANIWWIDFSPLPPHFATGALFVGGAALLAHAIRPARSVRGRAAVLAPIVGLSLIALDNAVRFYRVLYRHEIATSVPVPFSALIVAALVFIAWRVWSTSLVSKTPCFKDGAGPCRPGRAEGSFDWSDQRDVASNANTGPARPGSDLCDPTVISWPTKHPRLIFSATLAGCLLGFPLAQMYFFGHTDYRRRADVIVVFGARAHADGSPSGVLSDRVTTACQLYRDGLATSLVFSGGPGDGAIDEPHAMRRMALKLGVPDAAIHLDPAGLNTDATVQNTDALFRELHARRILAVSHYYHLPRIKMAYRQAGREVYTVPATQTFRLPGDGRFLVVRELVALGAYYLHPLRRG